MTTPTIDEIAAIAGRLSPAQREALLTVGNTPMDDLGRDKPGIARQLHALGLTFIDFSPSGYRLRAHLANKDTDHG